ncbi:MAG: molybdopterin-dependent oxidoreductase [Melioribacteraceae bacterium]
MKYDSYKSTCCYCGVGCGIMIKKISENKIIVEGDPDNPVNKGMLCSKGINLHFTVNDKSDRLLYPQMRLSRSHQMKRVTWDDALNRIATVFKTLIKKYGPDSVGFYVSGQCLTEEYYVMNKLMKGFIGSNNIDTNSRLCMSSAVTAYKLSLGEDAVPCTYEDIELADCFYISGANPAWCHPILFRRIEKHKNNNPDVKIIVADPRRTESCSIADIHLQLKPGTDIVLNNAIGRCLIEMNYIDKNFIEKHTKGFEEYKKLVMNRSLSEASDICDVPTEMIIKAAEFIGKSNGFISFWAMGLNQSVVGVKKNLSLINLSLITGKIGKPGCGPFSLTGQPNAMGGREVGGMCNLLPNHRELSNPEHRKYLQEFWGSKEIQSKPGLSATEMFDALIEGKLKAIWIVCTNPVVSVPDSRKVEKALQMAKFVVVQDISKNSQTLNYADVILPAASWAEKEGTMTNSERRISYLSPVVSPPGEALPDAEIIIRFAHKMGFGKAFNYKNMSEIFDEHCRLSKGTNADISALNYSILKEKGTVQWPFKSPNDYQTKRLFTDFNFYTKTQKAMIHATPDMNESESTNDDYPLVLTTGRIRDQWHTMTKTGKVQKLKQHIPYPYLEINCIDAEERNICDGDLVEIKNRRGNVIVEAKISEDIKKGVVFLPMHWGKILNSDLCRANNLTSSLIDPLSKEPDLKYSAVEVKKFIKPKQKIIIIGAGIAAFNFIKYYTKLNASDDIEIFSEELQPFYNRTLLPNYITGELNWESTLMKSKNDGCNISIKKGVAIKKINRDSKTVIDTNGNEHNYDVLILSTGSRPKIIESLNLNIEGIFYLRTINDADRLLPYCKKDNRIVIVGGGLLGIELASSLSEKGVQVAIIHRTSRLMDKYLDFQASQLLHDELTDRGIKIHFNDEVELVFGKVRLTSIKLKSGQYIECDALILATGTIPNIELAKNSGLECREGVIVNNYLQTSDSSIYAIGEIAEFNNICYGNIVAIKEQAEILARHLSGNMNVYYEGSLSMNSLKMNSFDLTIIGTTQIPSDDNNYEEIIFIDRRKRYYKKCVVYNQRLIGAVFIGDKSEVNEFKNLIKNKIELSEEKRSKLLRPSNDDISLNGKIICSCNSISESILINKIKTGITNIDELCNETGAGISCGSCRPEIKKILDTQLKKHKSVIKEDVLL